MRALGDATDATGGNTLTLSASVGSDGMSDHIYPNTAVILLGEEQGLALGMAPARRRELVAGRTALRTALGMSVPILPDDRGAPQLPAGWVGSISHKRAIAVAFRAATEVRNRLVNAYQDIMNMPI